VRIDNNTQILSFLIGPNGVVHKDVNLLPFVGPNVISDGLANGQLLRLLKNKMYFIYNT